MINEKHQFFRKRKLLVSVVARHSKKAGGETKRWTKKLSKRKKDGKAGCIGAAGDRRRERIRKCRKERERGERKNSAESGVARNKRCYPRNGREAPTEIIALYRSAARASAPRRSAFFPGKLWKDAAS